MVSEQAYLTAKRSVDDRALNRRVLERFAGELAARVERRGDGNEVIRILEVGAGTGTMVARLAAWNLLPDRVTYRAVDTNTESLAVAREQVPRWLEAAGYGIEHEDEAFVAGADGTTLRVRFEEGDAFELRADADAVVAGAFLDLLDLPEGLGRLSDLLAESGLLYAPITFDGLTGFVPADPFDRVVEEFYHRHMAEKREQGGGPTAGRRLLEAVPAVGGEVLGAGGSDWLVRPGTDGYPAEERLVLEFLLGTVVEAVSEFPADAVDPPELRRWERARRDQLDRAGLTLLAHNLDVLARI